MDMTVDPSQRTPAAYRLAGSLYFLTLAIGNVAADGPTRASGTRSIVRSPSIRNVRCRSNCRFVTAIGLSIYICLVSINRSSRGGAGLAVLGSNDCHLRWFRRQFYRT
jgi:hypothetical protein